MAKIIGNTTATPNPRPDWMQTDETKADYIKNKPTILTEEDVVNLIGENGDGGFAKIDQSYNPESENPQSGTAVKEAIETEVGKIDKYGNYGVQIVDGYLNVSSANPQDVIQKSGLKPITPAILDYAVLSVTDKNYDPNSALPQSGKAVAEAVNEIADQNAIQDRKIKALEDNQENFKADQTFDPTSPNAQSGVAVAEALATAGGGKWQTLIDTTLTEEQSGVSDVMIEIPNWELLQNATQMKLLIDVVAQEDITAQSTQITIRAEAAGAYLSVLCWSNCGACSKGEKLLFRGVYDIFQMSNKRNPYIGFYATPSKHEGANSATNATRVISKLNTSIFKDYPPYLRIVFASGGIIGAGSRIVMEVC